MAYFIHHHPHVFADLLVHIHRPRFWHVSRILHPSPGIMIGGIFAAITAPLLITTVLFVGAHSAQYSFSTSTCFASPTFFPGLTTHTNSSTFSLEQNPDVSVGSTPLLSTQTCIRMNKLPQENVTETLQLKGLLGITKSVEVSLDSMPSLLKEQHIPQQISLQDQLVFTLDKADSNFSYVISLEETNTSVKCTVESDAIACPVDQLELKQGGEYTAVLYRQFNDESTALYTHTFRIAEPLTVSSATLKQDETALTQLSTLVFKASKPLTSVGLTKLQNKETGSDVPITATIDTDTITITSTDNLPRNTAFTLSIESAVAADGAFLEKPYTLNFATSGGPKVQSINIGKTKVSPHSALHITFDIGLLPDQDFADFISLTSAGKSVPAHTSYSDNTAAIDPTGSLAACTTYELNIANGLQTIHGITGGSAWTYSFRTACYSTASIGSSVLGRSITAYTFGSGSETILFVGGLHGSESSSVHTLNSWIDELDAYFGNIPSNKKIVVIPNASPDSYATGSRLNARGVDLNRNFPSNDWTPDVFQPGNVELKGGGGTTALSEPESSALASYTQAQSPSLVLTYHAVASTVIYNGSGNSSSQANVYSSHSGFPAHSSAYEDSIFAYPTTGEYETWLHDKVGIPTLLVELATKSGNEIHSQKSAMWAVIGN